MASYYFSDCACAEGYLVCATQIYTGVTLFYPFWFGMTPDNGAFIGHWADSFAGLSAMTCRTSFTYW